MTRSTSTSTPPTMSTNIAAIEVQFQDCTGWGLSILKKPVHPVCAKELGAGSCVPAFRRGDGRQCIRVPEEHYPPSAADQRRHEPLWHPRARRARPFAARKGEACVRVTDVGVAFGGGRTATRPASFLANGNGKSYANVDDGAPPAPAPAPAAPAAPAPGGAVPGGAAPSSALGRHGGGPGWRRTSSRRGRNGEPYANVDDGTAAAAPAAPATEPAPAPPAPGSAIGRHAHGGGRHGGGPEREAQRPAFRLDRRRNERVQCRSPAPAMGCAPDN